MEWKEVKRDECHTPDVFVFRIFIRSFILRRLNLQLFKI